MFQPNTISTYSPKSDEPTVDLPLSYQSLHTSDELCDTSTRYIVCPLVSPFHSRSSHPSPNHYSITQPTFYALSTDVSIQDCAYYTRCLYSPNDRHSIVYLPAFFRLLAHDASTTRDSLLLPLKVNYAYDARRLPRLCNQLTRRSP